MKTTLYILRLAVTLLVITALAAALLAGVNSITADRIAANKLAKTQRALGEVLPGATGMAKTQDGSGIVQAVYTPEAASPVQGWAVQVAPTSGFAGEIVLMVGVNADGTVAGISVVSHAETPGLGAVAAAKTPAGEGFRESFLGLRGEVTVSDIDAISGATITSRAVAEGVSAALAYLENLK